MGSPEPQHRGFRATNHLSPSVNQNVTVNIPSEKPEEWPSCFPRKLKPSNGAKDRLDPYEKKRKKKRKEKKKKSMFIDAERYKLRSKEANDNHPNAESDSNHCAYRQS